MSLALPLRLRADGALAALADGTPAEVGQSVAVLLATRVGERRCEPAYGSADPLFGPAAPTGDGDLTLVDTAALARWESRATPDVVQATAAASSGTSG